MKKYILFISIFALFLCGFYPYTTYAHTLKIDGSIGVTMHIDPDDDPIAHLPAKVFFYFKDETNKLDLNQCNCNVQISNGSSIFFSEAFTGKDVSIHADTMTVSFPFVFPQEGVYQIEITGTSTSVATFQPFKLTYLQRVDREGTASSSSSLLQTLLGEHVAHIILFGGAILTSLYLIYIDRKEQAALRKEKAKVDDE